eukprot:GGOE01041583.1.p1 GENE.GGOE01041583.1~~GGOE01041583.1.p1  ORF type:complete len:371 (-),score=82.43 GGOE01041583.1:71-1183(-)
MRVQVGVVFLFIWMSLIVFLLLYVVSAVGGLYSQLTQVESRMQSMLRTQAQIQAFLTAGAFQKGPTGDALATVKSVALPVSMSREWGGDEELKTHFRSWDGGTEVFQHVLVHNTQGRRDHSLVVEVGAGDGRQAVAAAELGYAVVSVDAFINNLGRGKNLLRSKGPLPGNVTWVWSAVSDYRGSAIFWGFSGMGRLLDAKDAGAATNPANWKKDFHASSRTNVTVQRLDDIVHDSPFLLKVDVEGSEVKVFRGATRLLASKPPIIIVEFNPCMMKWSQGDDGEELLRQLHRAGYDLYDSAVSEPLHRGFMAKYGAQRPTGFHEFVQWLLKSAEFDHWGSWTDIIALLRAGELRTDGPWRGWDVRGMTRTQ